MTVINLRQAETDPPTFDKDFMKVVIEELPEYCAFCGTNLSSDKEIIWYRCSPRDLCFHRSCAHGMAVGILLDCGRIWSHAVGR